MHHGKDNDVVRQHAVVDAVRETAHGCPPRRAMDRRETERLLGDASDGVTGSFEKALAEAGATVLVPALRFGDIVLSLGPKFDS